MMNLLFLEVLMCFLYAINVNGAIGYNTHGYVSKDEYIKLQRRNKFMDSSNSLDPRARKSYYGRVQTTKQPRKIRHSHNLPYHSHHPRLDDLLYRMTNGRTTTHPPQPEKVDRTEEQQSTDNDYDGFEDEDTDNDNVDNLAPNYDEWEENFTTKHKSYLDDDEDYENDEEEEEDDGSWQAEEAHEQNFPSSFTQYKWDSFGSRQKVEETRREFMSSSKSGGENKRTAFLQHVKKILYESKCQVPFPKIVSVQDVHPDNRKTYIPRCTILHRCAEDTGCCEHYQTCGVKTQEIVELYFSVTTIGGGGNRIEKLSFFNHTECGCLDKTNSTSKRHLEPPPPPPLVYPSRNSGLSVRSTGNPENIKRCKCPAEYKPRYQNYLKCHCDCYEDNIDCLRMKRGKEYFSLMDRLCIKNNRCGIPACEYGPFQQNLGRCPKHDEQHQTNY